MALDKHGNDLRTGDTVRVNVEVRAVLANGVIQVELPHGSYAFLNASDVEFEARPATPRTTPETYGDG